MPAVLTQIAQAFSSGKTIATVQLAGTATWTAGGESESGSAALIANVSGQASMTLSLGSQGAWTESETQFGDGMGCQWSGADGIAHEGDALNCLKPAIWFLPSISLQVLSLAPGVGISDLGVSVVGPGTYRHLQAQANLADMSSQILPLAVTASTTDIGFDPSTLLPAVLIYAVRPDNGSSAQIPIQVLYSDYQSVNGAMIPFHVQRYVNGALQLDIQVTSAQIS